MFSFYQLKSSKFGSDFVLEKHYKRILLKLSGESLAGEKGFGIDFEETMKIAKTLKKLASKGIEVSVVVGGGNFWRGRSNSEMDRVKADHIGMMATMMNATALSDCINQAGAKSIVLSAVPFPQVGKHYSPERADKHLKNGEIVIFGYGTGNAFFSTDTASSLRAAEIKAEVILKAAANVNGVYDSDPNKNPNAKRYETLTFDEMLAKNLKVIDGSAAAMCRDNGISFLIFNMNPLENIVNILENPSMGTLVTP